MAQLAIVAVSAFSALNKGAQDRKNKYRDAEGLRDARNRQMASTTAAVSERVREKQRMYSRALAVSAASGAGVDDPGMVSLIGDLNAEGEYRVLSQLYVGSSEAEGLRIQSETAIREGDAALQAGYMNAATTVLSQYGNYGKMWGEAKGDFGKTKSWLSNKFGHGKRARGASLGIMDYQPLNSDVRYG